MSASLQSYLPRMTAVSFCRGLTTSHTTATGRAFTGAEVWKWCPRCFLTGADSGAEGGCRLICKRSVLPPLLQSNSGSRDVIPRRPRQGRVTTAEFVVLWQLIWRKAVCVFFTSCPVCLQPWKLRVRRRIFLKGWTQREDIAESSTLPDLLLRLAFWSWIL